MNYDNQPFEKESLTRELNAMREPVESAQGLDSAIRAMQAKPAEKRSRINPWVLRLGTVGAAAIGIALVVSVTTPKAYAQELKQIASLAKSNPTKYMKAYIYGGEAKPVIVTELWLDHDREKFLQYRDGKLDASNVSDGKLLYRYFAGNPQFGMNASASIDHDFSEHLSIDTIESMLNADYFKKRKIVKQTGVRLNGKTYDYYDFANGYYRIWVDPVSKLPVQREVFGHVEGKGNVLWERDVYDYPSSFPAGTFTAPVVPDVPYFDYPSARAKLEAQLVSYGSTQRVGDYTITLKAIVQDQQSVTVFFQSDADQGKFNDERRLPLPGIRFYTGNLRADEVNLVAPQGLKNERMYLTDMRPLKSMETIKLGVWQKDKFVGYAEFPYKNVLEVPYSGQLLLRPVPGQSPAAKAIPDKSTKTAISLKSSK